MGATMSLKALSDLGRARHRFKGMPERGRPTSGDGVMALARIEGAVGVRKLTAGDLLVAWELVQQLGQHGCIADIAGGALGGPDFQGFLLDPDVNLAPGAPLMRHWFKHNGERVWCRHACGRSTPPRLPP